ncbi:hypothetical protein SAMN05444166_7334 [Singulisphaera sp. GP187]|uniref:hypothetical protein n=1 Tax=Singulisphaera sp. GP187 TaxID=1882752 RepID=UPI000925BA51|nr:hypothetical protein [Singulisphaera sp. GP187]SIO63396.1 hypothetical protein SAMN05444166_7334 [Singulisphaera sp. GP187]
MNRFSIKRQSTWFFRIPGDPLEITTHQLDWGTSRDLDRLTSRRCQLIGERLDRGAWYLCPKFTVYSPTPSAEFFHAAREARSYWLMQTRQVMGKGDPRREKRKADRQGRRAAYLELLQAASDQLNSQRSAETIRLSNLPHDQRPEVILGGMMAKALAFTGIVFIDGQPLAPHEWHRLADQMIGSEPAPSPAITTIHRHCDLDTLKATGDPTSLAAIARAELQARLNRAPTAAIYVTPQLTLAAPGPSPEFFRQARDRESRWYGLTNRLLGNARRKALSHATDPATRTLVYSGTLVVNGEFFLAGLWPDRPISTSRLKWTPFLAPTVPPEFLGLTPFPAPEESNSTFSTAGPGTDRTTVPQENPNVKFYPESPQVRTFDTAIQHRRRPGSALTMPITTEQPGVSPGMRRVNRCLPR